MTDIEEIYKRIAATAETQLGDEQRLSSRYVADRLDEQVSNITTIINSRAGRDTLALRALEAAAWALYLARTIQEEGQ